MKRLDDEVKILRCVPDILKESGAALIRISSDTLTPIQKIQRRLLIDTQMIEVWDNFHNGKIALGVKLVGKIDSHTQTNKATYKSSTPNGSGKKSYYG